MEEQQQKEPSSLQTLRLASKEQQKQERAEDIKKVVEVRDLLSKSVFPEGERAKS